MSNVWPVWLSICGLVISIIGLLTVGVKLVSYADAVADRFNLGEAFVGGLFLGATTSLSGNIVAGVSSWNGYEQMAINNCLGGIAAQTSFLVIADLTYKQSNLEHAAASLPNLLSANLLNSLLALSLIGYFLPSPFGLSFHPISLLILCLYLLGLKWLKDAYKSPLWLPRITSDTKEDVPGNTLTESNKSLILKFSLSILIVGVLGYIVTKSAESLIAMTDLTQNIAGGYITSIITSLPELIVSIVAVRTGALTMAVANILGGNAFDTLMLVLSDALTLDNTIFKYYGSQELFLTFVNILMTSTIAIGLLRRERRGIAGIGFEGIFTLFIYVASFFLLVFKVIR